MLWLCFAPVKRARIDYIAEKATELGVVRAAAGGDAPHRGGAGQRRAPARQCGRGGGADRAADRAGGARAGRSRQVCSMRGRRVGDSLMCDETGGGPPIAEALSQLDEAARVGALGHRDRTRGRLRRSRAAGAASHKGCNVGGPRPAHPAGRYRGAGSAGMLAGACGRLATPDTASQRRLSRLQGYRLSACAGPRRCGTERIEQDEPAAGSREDSSCDRAAPTALTRRGAIRES